MQKLKELMALSKPKQKLVMQKQVISQQKQEFEKAQLEAKKAKELEQSKRLQEIAEFYDKPRKNLKLEDNQQPPIPLAQIKERLRKLYQPATLFGETPLHRYERMLKAEQFSQSHPNEDMKLYDEEFIQRVKQAEQYEQLDAKYRELLIEPKLLNDLTMRKKKQAMLSKQQTKTLEEMCDEIQLWLTKVVRGWGEVLEQKYHNQVSPAIQKKFESLVQTTKQLRSFHQVLKERKGDLDMIQSIYHIMNCCLVREYVQATSRYIDLSIGKAPWPMGVAMLGITVRRNAERLSYVLDNQITRKWMQGIKRLITVSQQMYPNEDRLKQVGYTMHRFT